MMGFTPLAIERGSPHIMLSDDFQELQSLQLLGGFLFLRIWTNQKSQESDRDRYLPICRLRSSNSSSVSHRWKVSSKGSMGLLKL